MSKTQIKPEAQATNEEDRGEDGRFLPGKSPAKTTPGRLRQVHVDIVERSYIVGLHEAARLAGVTSRTLSKWRKKYKEGLIASNARTNLFSPDGTLAGKEYKKRRWQVSEEVRALLEENVMATELAYFGAPIEMAMQVEAYFEECDEYKKPYTIPGLAHFLGFSSKMVLFRYQVKEGFFIVLNRAFLRIETQRNEQLITDKGPKSGHILDLKNNFGWVDETRTRTKREDIGAEDPGSKKVTVNQQNNVSIENAQLNALPAAPQSIEEWQKWYNSFMQAQKEKELAVIEAAAAKGEPVKESNG